MADDGGGVGSSSEKEYVAGCVTRNAFEFTNALRVTQPATCFNFENMLVSQVSILCILNIFFILFQKYGKN